MNELSGVLLLNFLLGFQTVLAGEATHDSYDTSETIESPIIIQGDELLESYRAPNGDIHYRVKFYGRDYCVRVTEPNPLDSFDRGATYFLPCR